MKRGFQRVLCCVVDPDPHGFALILAVWIRIQVGKMNKVKKFRYYFEELDVLLV